MCYEENWLWTVAISDEQNNNSAPVDEIADDYFDDIEMLCGENDFDHRPIKEEADADVNDDNIDEMYLGDVEFLCLDNEMFVPKRIKLEGLDVNPNESIENVEIRQPVTAPINPLPSSIEPTAQKEPMLQNMPTASLAMATSSFLLQTPPNESMAEIEPVASMQSASLEPTASTSIEQHQPLETNSSMLPAPPMAQMEPIALMQLAPVEPIAPNVAVNTDIVSGTMPFEVTLSPFF